MAYLFKPKQQMWYCMHGLYNFNVHGEYVINLQNIISLKSELSLNYRNRVKHHLYNFIVRVIPGKLRNKCNFKHNYLLHSFIPHKGQVLVWGKNSHSYF